MAGKKLFINFEAKYPEAIAFPCNALPNENAKKQIMETQEKIIQAFKDAGKALRAGEIAEMAGLDKKEVDKAIKKMKADETIVSPKRCFYDIKR